MNLSQSDSHRLCLSVRRRLTLSLSALAYVMVYTGRQNLSIASPLMQVDGIIDSVGIGIMGSAFFFVYAVGRIVNGYIGDRVNPRTMLIGGMGAAGLCNLAVALMPPVPAMILLWGINGFFQSMLWGPALGMVVKAYEGTPESGRAVLVMSTGIGLGSLVAVAVATGAASFGVRAVFYLPAFLILGAGALLFFVPNPGKPDKLAPVPSAIKLLQDRALLRVLFPAAVHGVVKDNLILWIPLLFTSQYGLDLQSAAFFVFMMPLANFIGRLLFPPCFHLLHDNQTRFCAVAFGVCVAALLPFLFVTPPAAVAALLLALVAVATTMINAIFLSLFPASYAAQGCVSSVAGLTDAATYFGSAVGSAVFGSLIAAFGYTAMLMVWILLCLAAIPVMLCKKRERKIQ